MKLLLLDGYSSRTLACVRSFGRSGLPFAVGGHTVRDMSLHSRYSRETFVYTSPYVSVNGFIRDIAERARSFAADAILPTSEAAIIACNARAAELPVRTIAPNSVQIADLFDKNAVLSRARTAGLPVPRTWLLEPDTVGRLEGEGVPLPAIIKSNASNWLEGDTIRRGGRTSYVYTRDELLAEAERQLEVSPQVLVQEFIDGYGVGVSGIFREGQPVALFGHRRIRESTPTGGPSAVAVSIAVTDELREAARLVMSGTGYTGPAMVEFKVSRVDGTPYLMEVNGRLWGSVLLAMEAGLDIPGILMRTLAELDVGEEATLYRPGVVGRYLVGDTKHLLLALRGRPRSWTGAFPTRREALASYVWLFFARDSHELLLARDDPKPFFARIAQGRAS